MRRFWLLALCPFAVQAGSVKRLVFWLLLATASQAEADAPPPLTCEPSAACAVQMARDAALQAFATTRTRHQLELALKTLAWSGKFDEIEDPRLRERFEALVSQANALPEIDQTYLRRNLAAAMAAYGFVDQALALSADSSTKGREPMRLALACTYARRGDFRDAFATIEALDYSLLEYDAFEDMADCIARTAKPEFARAITKQVPGTARNADRIARIVALTEREAGHHAAAREAAMTIKDDGWCANTLYELIGRYQRDANYPESIATGRLLRDVAARPGNEKWLQYAMRNLLADHMNSHAHAEIVSLVEQFPADDRAHAFLSVLMGEDDPGVIRDLARRMPELTSSEQTGLQLDLLLARVRVGDLKAGDALGLAADQQEFAKEAIRLVRRLGPEHQALARDLLQAATAANGKRPYDFWIDIAWAQARLGMLEEAHRTVEKKIRPAGTRGTALMGVGAAEAVQGKAEDAARSRTRAAKLLKSDGSAGNFYVAYYLMDADYPEAAMEHILASVERKQDRFAYDDLPQEVVKRLARRGDVKRALQLANAMANHSGGDPEPFVDVYTAANGLPDFIVRNKVQ